MAHSPSSAENEKGPRRRGFSRRSFLTGSGGAALAVGIASLAPGCGSSSNGGGQTSLDVPIPDNQFAERPSPFVPLPPATPPGPGGMLRFFSPDEAKTADALFARIMPGDASDPGAREAGVLYYVDFAMTQSPSGANEPIYSKPPYAQTYTGDSPPSDPIPNAQFQIVWVKKDELKRYGPQSPLSPREVYRMGLANLDSYSQKQKGQKFADLSEGDQDGIIKDLATDASGDNFKNPSGPQFFTQVRDHVTEGMFADPAYGANRDMVGWKLVGYPGAQRGYTEQDLKNGQFQRPPQSLADLHHYEPGPTTQSNPVYPIRGAGSH